MGSGGNTRESKIWREIVRDERRTGVHEIQTARQVHTQRER